MSWLSLLLFGFLQGPDPHTAQPERPSVATHAHTVAPGWIEIEAGLERQSSDGIYQGAAMPLVAKIGVTSRTQVNVSVSLAAAPDTGISVGSADLLLKWRFVDRAKGLGRLAVLTDVTLPRRQVGDPSPSAFGVTAIASRSFGSVSLDLNIGATRHGGDGTTTPKVSTVWAASFSGPLAGAVGWGAELHGFPRTRGPAGEASSVGVLIGPTFVARRWLTFDTGVIIPITGPELGKIYVGGVWNAGRVWK